MAITIDWSDRIIYVPRNDLPLVQLFPTEIRDLDLNWFRLQLKDIEDSEEGMVNPDTHRHNTTVSLGGLIYARIIEIINDFTITFEDGQYAINLIGANSNVGDRVNVNQVSVRSANSAGLIQTREIEYSSFNGGVTIDVLNGITGTAYPIGTPPFPSNNLIDAEFIAELRGFPTIYVKGDLPIGVSQSISNYRIKGEGATFNTAKTKLTLISGCNTANTVFEDAWIEGYQSGEAEYNYCVIGDIANYQGTSYRCKMVGPTQTVNTAWADTYTSDLKDCYSIDWCILDYNHSPINHMFANYSGKLKVINCTHSGARLTIQLDAGSFWLDSSCAGGYVELKGIGDYINDSTGVVIDTVGLIGSREIEHASFNGGITIDVFNGAVGINYPHGTAIQPVNNLEDARNIADIRGFNTFYIKGNLTLNSGDDIRYCNIRGEDRDSSSLTLLSGCLTTAANIYDLAITGVCSGRMNTHRCHMSNITGLCASGGNANITDTHIMGSIQLRSFADQMFNFVNCVGTTTSGNSPTVDINGCSADIHFTGFAGIITFSGDTDPQSNLQMDISSGHISLDSSCSAGNITLRGIGVLEDNSTGSNVDTTGLVVLTAIEYSSFNGRVTIDSINGFPGLSYPHGTPSNPVDTIEDALAIAFSRGFDTLLFNESIEIGLGRDSQPLVLDNYVIHGKNLLKTIVSVLPTCSCTNSEFRYCLLTGTLDGGSTVRECLIADLYYVNGYVYESILYSNAVIQLGGVPGSNAFLGDCKSGFGDVPAIIDFNSQAVNFTVRGFKGNLKLINCTQGVEVALDLDSAHLVLDSSVTYGNIVVTGAGTVENNMTTFSGTLDISGMLEPANIAIAFMQTPIGDNTALNTVGQAFASIAYGSKVYLSDTGVSGTYYGLGVIDFPVNNVADGLELSHKFSCDRLHFHSDMSLLPGDDLSYLILEGHVTETVTAISGSNITSCIIRNLTFTGEFTGGNLIFEGCRLLDCYNVTGIANGGTLGGEIHLLDLRDNWFTASNSTGSSIQPISLYIGQANCNISNWQGLLYLHSQNHVDSQVNISLVAGAVIIDSSCTAGSINIFGQGEVVNNSTGSVVNIDNIMTKQSISDALLDKSLIGYESPNTVAMSMKYSSFGDAIYINAVSGVSGTAFPIGTPFNPVDNLNDARIIADTYNIRSFNFLGTLFLEQSYTDWTFVGNGALFNDIVVVMGQDISNSYFKNCVLTSSMLGSNVQYQDCLLSDLSGAVGLMSNCGVAGTVTVASGGVFQGKNIVASGVPSVIDFGASSTAMIQFQADSGLFRIDNMSSGNVAHITNHAGEVELSSSCVGGYVSFSGLATIINNSSGVIVADSNVVNSTTVSNAVWENTVALSVISDLSFIKDIEGGRWRIINNQMLFFKEDNTTEILRFNLFDSSGNPTAESVFDRQRV